MAPIISPEYVIASGVQWVPRGNPVNFARSQNNKITTSSNKLRPTLQSFGPAGLACRPARDDGTLRFVDPDYHEMKFVIFV